MRKSILFMSAAVILAAASCQKEQEIPSLDKAPVTFTASVDGADTKTILSGNQSNWNGVEQIRVHDGIVSKVFESEVDNAPTAEFAEVDQTVVLTGDDYLAFYPAPQSAGLTWSGDVAESVKGMWLDDFQSAVADTYNPSAHVAVAYAQAGEENLAFKNVVSLVKLTVGNENVGDITFKGNNNEPLAGNFNMTWTNGEPVVDFTGVDNVKTVVNLRGDKVQGETYYLAVLPQVLEGGFTVEFNVESVKYAKTASASYTIGRNQIIDLGTIEFDVNPITYKSVYLKPSAVWEYAEPACYAAWSWPTGGEGAWFKGVDSNEDGVYEFEVPSENSNIIFVAMKSDETLDWGSGDSNVYYKTSNLPVPETEGQAYVAYSEEWKTLAEAVEYTEPTVTVYLKPSETWAASAQSYGVYAWIENSMTDWFEMTETSDEGIYSANIPEYYPNIIFVAKNTTFSADWNNKLAQTEALLLPIDENDACVIKSAEPVNEKSSSLWMTLEDAKVYVEPTEPVLVASKWGVVGSFTDWGNSTTPDITMYETDKDELFVAYNVEIPANATFKIRANSSWTDDSTYGTTNGNARNTNEIVGVWPVGDATNIKVANEGTYDIYFYRSLGRVYLMEAGKVYVEATPPSSSTVYGLIGSFTSWTTDVVMSYSGDNVYSVSYNIPQNGEWKIRVQGDWSKSWGWNNFTNYVSATKADDNIKISTAGNYIIYFNPSKNKICAVKK